MEDAISARLMILDISQIRAVLQTTYPLEGETIWEINVKGEWIKKIFRGTAWSYELPKEGETRKDNYGRVLVFSNGRWMIYQKKARHD